ncbi:MAG: hypothetical protein ACEQSB_05825 [Undibacterium sp.]
MEQFPLPDFAAIEARKREEAARKREGLVRRFSEFLEREANGDVEHPAMHAKEALEQGSNREALDYLKLEIDRATDAGDELRRGDLMRWKTSLSSNGN